MPTRGSQMSVRVRFASCPTAHLHVGDLRTAVYNWLFARHTGGRFVLRLEDVEHEDSPPPGTQSLCETLSWLGLEWDEGPGADEAYGPYTQSGRLDLYRCCARQLVDCGRATLCPPSPDRLTQPRQRRMEPVRPTERHPDCSTAGPEVRRGPRIVRLRSPTYGQTTVLDQVLGTHVFEHNALADVVLLEADGLPTRLLADVVDDHHMQITHVIQDHQRLSDVPYQIRIYEALGWDPPNYAHLPPILWPERCSPEGRGGDVPLAWYRERGYLPQALINHVALLGWRPRGKRGLLPLDDLAARFDLRRISRSPQVPDVARLDWFNRQSLRRMGAEQVTRMLVARWQRVYGVPDRAERTDLAPSAWQRTLALAIREESCNLSQAVCSARFAFEDHVERGAVAEEVLAQPYAAQVLTAFIHGLACLGSFDYGPIDASITDLRWRFKASHGIRSRDVMYVIRAALTGRMDGPCLVTVCQLLGREQCIERAQALLAEKTSKPGIAI